VNGVDPLAEDDDDRLKEIARQFEEKYVSTGYTWKRKPFVFVVFLHKPFSY
jgi:hypothetical protein